MAVPGCVGTKFARDNSQGRSELNPPGIPGLPLSQEVIAMLRTLFVAIGLIVILQVGAAGESMNHPLYRARLQATLSDWESDTPAGSAGWRMAGDQGPENISFAWSQCLASVCLNSGCLGSGCVGSICIGSLCGGSYCGVSACQNKTTCLRECTDGPPNPIDPMGSSVGALRAACLDQ